MDRKTAAQEIGRDSIATNVSEMGSLLPEVDAWFETHKNCIIINPLMADTLQHWMPPSRDKEALFRVAQLGVSGGLRAIKASLNHADITP